MNTSTEVGNKQENTLLNLLFNIVLPVIVLNQLSKRLGDSGPLIGLIVALAFPFFYGTYEYIKSRKHNWMSILGLINILFTGGFALVHLEGIWFAVKEAAFPFILGVAVLASSITNRPLFKAMLWNPGILQVGRIETAVAALGRQNDIQVLFKRTTLYFSVSFFVSALLNFILAARIFTPISTELNDTERAVQLNEQIASMTWQGYIVIALPLMMLMMILLWYTLKRLEKISELKIEDLMAGSKPQSSK